MTGKMTGHQLFNLQIELSALLEDNSAKTQIGTATHLSLNYRLVIFMTISCTDITENMPYGYALNKLVKDEAGYVLDYIILDVNSQFEEYTEILASEIVGRNASEIISNMVDDFAEWLELCTSIVVTGTSRRVEIFDPVVKRWFRIIIYRAGENEFVTLFEDFTAEKVREELFFEKFQQDQEYRQLRRLVNRIPVIVCEFSDSFLLKYANRSFCEYFGLNNHDLIGSTNISARLYSNQKASPGGSMLTRFRTMLPGSIPTQSMSL